MKINVCYTVTKNIDMEVSDEFKELEKTFTSGHYNEEVEKWQVLAGRLEDIILNRLPEDSEILGVYDTETHEIIYEN